MRDPSEVTTRREGGARERDSVTATATPTLRDRAALHAEAMSDAPSVGTQIDRYTVLEQLGAGGMGEVYAAFDNKLDRKVALKLLRHRSEEYEARLMREAQAMARLLHPNVVAVFDTGVTGNRLYLAMEFVRGKTLRGWQKEKSRSLDEVLRVYRDAGEGLAAAHAVGLVHRDFKPDNVLIADDGRIKVTDFGIARATGENAPHTSGKRKSSRPPPRSLPPPSSGSPQAGASLGTPLTEEGALLGTPGYMAPEQFLCEAVDERTDQFSFCVSLYEALYGVRPFGGRLEKPSLEQIAQATLEGKIDEAPKGSAVPDHVRAVLLRGLSAESPARYPSMRELLADLARDPRKQRRRRLAMVAAAVFTAATAAAGVIGTARHRAALRAACAAEAGAIYTHWGGADRSALTRAILADPGATVRERADRTVAALDAFAAAWRGEQESSCTETRLAKTQSDDAYEKRSACLVGARQTFDEMVRILSEPDPSVHRHALAVTNRALVPPRLCAGREGERSYTPLPPDAARRALVLEARNLTTRARVLLFSGRVKQAADEAERAAALARKAAAPSDEAVALVVHASAFGRTIDPRALARAQEALLVAERAGNDHTAVEAAELVAFEIGERLGRIDEAEAWLALAWAKMDRLGGDDSVRFKLERARGVHEDGKGNSRAAVAATAEAVRIGRSLWGQNSVDVCMALSNQAKQMLSGFDPEGAVRIAREAIACLESTTGADNADLAYPYGNLGDSLYSLGRISEALDVELHAVELRRELGPGDALSLLLLSSVAMAEDTLGRFREAEEQGTRILANLKGRVTADGITGFAEAQASYAVGMARAHLGDNTGAREYCGRSVRKLEEMKALAPDVTGMANALGCLGEAALAAGDVAQARAHLERSVTLRKRLFQGELAGDRLALARALSLPPRPDVARARTLAVQARDELLEYPNNPALAPMRAEVDRWLAEHPEGSR